MGSDFTYSDIAGRKLNQITTNSLKNQIVIILLRVNQKMLRFYSRILYVVHKEYNVVSKAIFYDREGVRLKTLTTTKVFVNGVHVVILSEMKNHVTNGKTLLMLSP